MSYGGDPYRDIDVLAARQAESAADIWIGPYQWTTQAGIPADMNRILRAMWIHGYIAGASDREGVSNE